MSANPTSDPFLAFEERLRRVVREEIEAALAKVATEREEAPIYLDTKEAAAFAGLHERTVRRMAASGEIKSCRAGHHLRFRREDLEAYLERGGR